MANDAKGKAAHKSAVLKRLVPLRNYKYESAFRNNRMV